MPNFFQRFFDWIFDDKAGYTIAGEPEALIPPETAIGYGAIISRVMPYFEKLSDANKKRFLKRVYNFKKDKVFSFSWFRPS